MAARGAWVFRPEGDKFRRVVASPRPKRIVGSRAIEALLQQRAVVIALGGGGIPSAPARQQRYSGVDCAIDADLASAVLARDLGADHFILLTHADGIYANAGEADERRVRFASPQSFGTSSAVERGLAATVAAACHFVQTTGRQATIGAAHDLSHLLNGEAGTTIAADVHGVTLAEPGMRARTRLRPGTWAAVAPADQHRETLSALHTS
jgi:carbamate kinase